MKITVGSRESKLAVIQSNIVIDSLRESHPEIDVELLTMKTTGDKILDKTLDKIGGKGLFVKELDKALVDGRADLTVHSLKDMPMQVSEELPLVAFSKREDPRDVLVLPIGKDKLDKSKPIGSSSKRRQLHLKKLYPDMEVKPIRGNLQTRLKKLDEGEFSAIVLAYAGLKRLGLEDRVSRVFSPSEMVPAACQGILAVQARKDFDESLLRDFNDEETKTIAMAERSFVTELDGGCSSPVAAFAEIQDGNITLTGFYVDEFENQLTKTVTGPLKDGVALGRQLAQNMKRKLKEMRDE
ncbi:porphobilinogen deaminase [Clostridiales bacterium S5-A14a]|nr:porphobilinogen deaminase [Clostridiales bacterium S5-A14a]